MNKQEYNKFQHLMNLIFTGILFLIFLFLTLSAYYAFKWPDSVVTILGFITGVLISKTIHNLYLFIRSAS